MSDLYCAVTRNKPSDELKHYKYIRKEKKNGKWIYYYKDDMFNDDSTQEGYAKTKGKPGSKYGTYEHGGSNGKPKYTIKVKKGNSLFTKETTHKDPRSRDATKIRRIGKIEQGVDSVKKKTKKIGKKTIKSINKQIGRGRKLVNSLFD